MVEHILDRPIWGSLTTRHARFAEGEGAALRFQADISRFAAMDEDDSDGMAALGALIASTGQIAVAQLSPVDCPEDARQVHGFLVHQMLQRAAGGGVEDPELIRLGPADAEEMLALAILAKPGPFELRTHLLGEYWGIREAGELVAMAGERMKLPGFTEISVLRRIPITVGAVMPGGFAGMSWRGSRGEGKRRFCMSRLPSPKSRNIMTDWDS